MSDSTTHLVQILLPMADQDGAPFPAADYAAVRTTLVERFDGLTAWSRSLAEGIWVDDAGKPVHDDIVIYEVMADAIDAAWWATFRGSLERRFRQESIVIRAQPIRRL